MAGFAPIAWAREYPQRAAWWMLGALVVLGTAVRLKQLTHSLFEAYAFRQTQTAFVVRGYAENGINLLVTPLPVFGPDANVPMEFPLFQAIASLFVHAGLSSDAASRLLGLISFQACAVLIAVLALRWHGRVVAIVAVFLFEFLPYGLAWGASSMIDFFSVALALTMVVTLDNWFRGGRWPWLVVASVAAIAGFLVKVTTVPSWGILVLASLILVIRAKGWTASWKRLLVGLVVAPAAGLAAAIGWTRYADSVKTSQPLTDFLTSSSLTDWNFGTIAQRLDIQSYFAIYNRVSSTIAGPLLAALLLAVLAIIFQKSAAHRITTAAWLLVAVSAPLVFFNLYVVHEYYLMAIYPALVVASAIGLVWLARLIPGRAVFRAATLGVTTLLLLAVTATSTIAGGEISQFVYDAGIPANATDIAAATTADANIVMIGCDWNPVYLYYAHRAGVMFRGTDSDGFWKSNDIEQYGYLYTCNPELDPADFLPPGVTLGPAVGPAGLYQLAVVRQS